jgi:hypothetical protein
VSSPVTRTVRGSPSIFSGVAPPTPCTSNSSSACVRRPLRRFCARSTVAAPP